MAISQCYLSLKLVLQNTLACRSIALMIFQLPRWTFDIFTYSKPISYPTISWDAITSACYHIVQIAIFWFPSSLLFFHERIYSIWLFKSQAIVCNSVTSWQILRSKIYLGCIYFYFLLPSFLPSSSSIFVQWLAYFHIILSLKERRNPILETGVGERLFRDHYPGPWHFEIGLLVLILAACYTQYSCLLDRHTGGIT